MPLFDPWKKSLKTGFRKSWFKRLPSYPLAVEQKNLVCVSSGLGCSSCSASLPNQAGEVEEKTTRSPCSDRLLQQGFVECFSTGDGLDFDDIVALLVDLYAMLGPSNDCS